MSKLLIVLLLSLNSPSLFSMNYEELSQDFLYAVRVEENVTTFKQQLARVSLQELSQSLSSENQKKAFWLNIYNAYIQLKAKENPSMIEENRNDFFSNEWIPIAGQLMSFDDIEHGMLRHSQWKYGMGYIEAWFPGAFEKALRVEEVDYRIHFALNCGAAGCPPIAFYDARKLEEQLDIATQGFMKLNTIYDAKKNTVEVSKILSWFQGDFGGRSGILSLLKRYQLIDLEAYPKITYKEYDWTLSLRNYIN